MIHKNKGCWCHGVLRKGCGTSDINSILHNTMISKIFSCCFIVLRLREYLTSLDTRLIVEGIPHFLRHMYLIVEGIPHLLRHMYLIVKGMPHLHRHMSYS